MDLYMGQDYLPLVDQKLLRLCIEEIKKVKFSYLEVVGYSINVAIILMIAKANKRNRKGLHNNIESLSVS